MSTNPKVSKPCAMCESVQALEHSDLCRHCIADLAQFEADIKAHEHAQQG